MIYQDLDPCQCEAGLPPFHIKQAGLFLCVCSCSCLIVFELRIMLGSSLLGISRIKAQLSMLDEVIRSSTTVARCERSGASLCGATSAFPCKVPEK